MQDFTIRHKQHLFMQDFTIRHKQHLSLSIIHKNPPHVGHFMNNLKIHPFGDILLAFSIFHSLFTCESAYFQSKPIFYVNSQHFMQYLINPLPNVTNL
jgi:hypothetical protein